MIEELLRDHRTGMSKFQDDYFVTSRAGGTIYGQYKQSLRELYKRFRGLRQLISDRRRLDITIEELQYDIETFSTSTDKKEQFKCRKLQVDLDEKLMSLEESDRVIADTKREFTNFYRQAVFLKGILGTSELTDEKFEELEQEMWEFKIKEMACVDFITTGRLRNSTFEFIHACPHDMKFKIMLEIKDNNKLIEWYENKNNIIIPKNLEHIPEPSFKNLEQLTFENATPELSEKN